MSEQLGFSRVTDNTIRRRHFEAQHPHVVIEHTDDPWEWCAVWYDAGERREVIRPELGDLLDKLDVELGR